MRAACRLRLAMKPVRLRRRREPGVPTSWTPHIRLSIGRPAKPEGHSRPSSTYSSPPSLVHTFVLNLDLNHGELRACMLMCACADGPLVMTSLRGALQSYHDSSLVSFARAVGTIGLGITAGLELSLPHLSLASLYAVPTLSPRDRLHFWSDHHKRAQNTLLPVVIS